MRSPAFSTASICCAHLVQERQHLLDRFAVLALQFIDRRQARFHLLQPAGVGFQAREVIAQPVGRFLERQARRPADSRARRRARDRCGTTRPAAWPRRAPARSPIPASRRAPRRPRPRSPAAGPDSAGRAVPLPAPRLRPACRAAPSISLRWNSHRSSRRSFSCSDFSSFASSAPALRQRL